MDAREINRDNFATALAETLEECQTQLSTARGGHLAQDLGIAVEALQGIKSELSGELPQRARGLRTGLFIRYALDSNDQLAMDSDLKDKVVRIEDIYKRL